MKIKDLSRNAQYGFATLLPSVVFVRHILFKKFHATFNHVLHSMERGMNLPPHRASLPPWKWKFSGLPLILAIFQISNSCLWLVNEGCTITLVLAGMQVDQFPSVIDCAGNITNFTENCAGKSFFPSRLKRDLLFNFCVCQKKVKSWIEQNILLVLFTCKIRLIIYCKVLKVFSFKFLSSF